MGLMYVFSAEQCSCGLSPPVSRTLRTLFLFYDTRRRSECTVERRMGRFVRDELGIIWKVLVVA